MALLPIEASVADGLRKSQPVQDMDDERISWPWMESVFHVAASLAEHNPEFDHDAFCDAAGLSS